MGNSSPGPLASPFTLAKGGRKGASCALAVKGWISSNAGLTSQATMLYRHKLTLHWSPMSGACNVWVDYLRPGLGVILQCMSCSLCLVEVTWNSKLRSKVFANKNEIHSTRSLWLPLTPTTPGKVGQSFLPAAFIQCPSIRNYSCWWIMYGER